MTFNLEVTDSRWHVMVYDIQSEALQLYGLSVGQ